MFPRFGNSICFFEPEEKPIDPWKPDPRAREEMRAYDRQPAEVRAAFRESLYGAAVHDTVERVIRRGPSDAVKAIIREKGLLPCDLGTEGVVIETLRLADELDGRNSPRLETKRIRSELKS